MAQPAPEPVILPPQPPECWDQTSTTTPGSPYFQASCFPSLSTCGTLAPPPLAMY